MQRWASKTPSTLRPPSAHLLAPPLVCADALFPIRNFRELFPKMRSNPHHLANFWLFLFALGTKVTVVTFLFGDCIPPPQTSRFHQECQRGILWTRPPCSRCSTDFRYPWWSTGLFWNNCKMMKYISCMSNSLSFTCSPSFHIQLTSRRIDVLPYLPPELQYVLSCRSAINNLRCLKADRIDESTLSPVYLNHSSLLSDKGFIFVGS